MQKYEANIKRVNRSGVDSCISEAKYAHNQDVRVEDSFW